MDPQIQQYLLIGGAVTAVIVIALAIRNVVTRRERKRLRQRFGTEFDRTVRARGSKRAAVKDLRQREVLRQGLELRELNAADRELVRRHMAALQFRFVDNPGEVLLSTGRVVTEVLRACGYPVAEDREKALRLASVDYPAEAGAIRLAVTGDFHGDAEVMRRTFVGVREALTKIAGVTAVEGGAGPPPPLDLDISDTQSIAAVTTEIPPPGSPDFTAG